MNTQLRHVMAAVYDKPWFVREQTLATIADLVRMHAQGGRLSQEEIEARVEGASAAAGPRSGPRTMGAVAVIPVYGTIMPRANLLSAYSGGATIASIRENFRAAMAAEEVGSILLDIDSPGGYTDGVDELAAEIRQARGTKPIVAIANYCMASAALYIGSAADELVASPSSEVGWIGTVMVHQEFSKMAETEGVTTTIIRNPPGKYGGNQYEPLSDQARAEFQAIIDERTSQFVSAVAKGRGVSVATVKADFGQGGGMTASKAKAAGLVDRVETFDQAVQRLASGKGPIPRGTTASATAMRFVDPMPVAGDQGGTVAGDDPDASSSGEPAAPPDRSTEAEAALALARAKLSR